MSIRIKEVARHAGVSIGTVSNVLNRPDLVATPTRERVLAAISTLGYVRNDPARQLRAGRSRTVAIVVLDVANPFFADVIRGAESVVEANGDMLVVCNSGGEAARERRHLEMLQEQRVQGVLITSVGGPQSHVESVLRNGIPVVLVDRRATRRDRCSVAVDDVLGGRLAGAHLADQGHRRIAFVGGPMSFPQVAHRRRGIKQALTERDGPPIDLRVAIMPQLTFAAGREAAAQFASLPRGQRPTGIFCANDLLALGVLQELTRRGLRVPEDVAIIGYDDIEYAEAATVPLTSVRQPREKLGRAAATLLLDEVASGPAHRHERVVFTPELVVRESTAG